MSFLRRHRTAIASGAVLSVAAALLVAYAVTSTGHPVRQVELNDGGVWVTSDRDGLFGRLNKPVGALDGAFYPPGGAQQSYQLDIAQDAAAVVAWDRAGGKLYPVDAARAVALSEQSATVAGSAHVALAGGTLAVLDPNTGKVWAARVDPKAGVAALADVDAKNLPVADVEGKAGMAVGVDGSVHVVAESGKTATVRPNGTGFGSPERGDLGRALREPRVTAVGEQMAVVDGGSGTVFLPDGVTASVGVDAVPQQPGPPADDLVVATRSALKSVRLAGGVQDLYQAKGEPAAPVRLAGCVHAAWAGAEGGYARSCGGAPVGPGNLADEQALVKPVFRVNRTAVVLNDLDTGAVWDLATQRKVDDWSSVKPPPEQDRSDRENEENTTDAARDQPPKAVDDVLGARPGRTTVLHVLDNDSDPSGDILAVSEVTAPDNPGATLAIAPDGQTVEVTLPEGSGDVHFRYTVDDGRGLNASAAVTVQARTPDQNTAPAVRAGAKPRDWAVVSGGRLTMPVLADWRDPDGDPIVLVAASSPAGVATTTPAGFVEFAAPVAGGSIPVDFEVTDGVGEATRGSERVAVQAATDSTTVAPTAQPDVARGQVGRPVEIQPLDNDLPGADPTDPTAVLRLATEPATPEGVRVVTDLKAGTITVTGGKPGTLVLEYTAAFGNAPFAKAAIRVDLAAAPDSPAPPVAMPDTAVLRGQQPVLVDVLANDFSPSGALLAVQAVTPAGTQLEAAVVKGRWLRINALDPVLEPNPQLIRYTVTDGVTGAVNGEVTVTQLPPPDDDTPVPKDDHATVRAGDAVEIPVLDNDTAPAGGTLSLQANVRDAPERGRLNTVTRDGRTDVGTAYVAGRLVRFVAPTSVDTPTTVTVEYVAQNAAGDQATGRAHVVVNPAPTPATPNQPPSPRPVEVRAVAGDTAVVPVATSGVDPDGDSVSVTGTGSPAALGRVLGLSATSLTYQAFPGAAGTDQFTYVVTDSHGRRAEAAVRVAVVPPGDPQPPVAVDDVVTAAPGTELVVDVLANDFRDDTAELEPLAARNPGVQVTGEDGLVKLTAPKADGKPTVVAYGISNGIGRMSVATLTVRGQEDYNAPPTAGDLFPRPAVDARTAEVEPLKEAGDQDSAELKITRVFADDAKVSGDRVTVPVGEHPRTIAYEIADDGGATGVGLIHVPAPGSGAPYARPDQLIEVPVDGSVTVAVADHLVTPSGKRPRLTLADRVWAAPAGLAVAARGDRELVLTAKNGYTGPAAITFEVTDGETLTDGLTSVVTIPVQVGPDTPVLRCPDGALTLIEGGVPVKVDVTTVCHVWVADRSKVGELRYSASWKDKPEGVSVDGSGGRVLSISAAAGAQPGSTGVLEVSVDGAGAAKAFLAVRVTGAPPPSVSPVTVDGVKAGDTATVNLLPYVRSALRDQRVSVVAVNQVSGGGASVNPEGSSVRITPNADTNGQLVFNVVVTDVPDTSRDDRKVTGRITVNVLGAPDAPGTPVPGRSVQSKVVELSWSAPASNGAPIDSYEVDYGSGKQTCAASPCAITGLTNGTAYTFTVRAHNLVGWSRPSGRSESAQPNTVPGAVTGLTASDPGDGTLRLSWSAAQNDGSAVLRHEISWAGGGRATANGTSTTVTGLDNEARYVFTVIAVNAQGPGPSATVAGQSSGTPARPAPPTFSAADGTGGSSKAVTVSWAAVSPNGPGPTTYTVRRSGRGDKTVCSDVTATSCADDGLANDGTVYSYTVTASNASGHTSPPSAPAELEATSTPDPITNFTAEPTGRDGQAEITFDAPPSHGRSNTVSCTWSGGSCGTWTYPVDGRENVSYTINGLPNGEAVPITLQSCNGSGGGSHAGNPCNTPAVAEVTAYGPIKDLEITTCGCGDEVEFTISVNPNGKPATVEVETSKQKQTFTTEVGLWTWKGSDKVGYDGTDTIKVTVSDEGRKSVTRTKTQDTPPPPPSVTVSKGAACGPSGCTGTTTCTTDACAYITVQTKNFPGPVTCTFTSDRGSDGFVDEAFGPNETKQTRNYYGYPGELVHVTCGGVKAKMTW
ncbi:Ig-like domain-containing protein [Saccharothrix obliqua]|uniref:Ig-like domain-containing protein n=1 Tax=Saccharothrix obliqua TaxID=2861747 RepID=UPI001C5FE63D|nr:Ig-like domain-containing protein [Saccharothrix obliqua]MBW4720619.1 cadherin-like domain-containing protein [Saccharothrix obliqua]